MKPKEFDELIRQSFDQNDFAYEPRSWSRLTEQLDGRTKKRSMMVWWLMPLAGIAASVALAVGTGFFYQQSENGVHSTRNSIVQQRKHFNSPATVRSESGTSIAITLQQYSHITETHKAAPSAQNASGETVDISYENAVGFQATGGSKKIILKDELIPKKPKNSIEEQYDGYGTFKPQDEEQEKPVKSAITLTGGVNHGANNSGYMLGANFRHMINSRLFVESDVAFANSNNSQVTEVAAPATTAMSAPVARHVAGAARSTVIESSKATTDDEPAIKVVDENQSYNLYYAQVTPGLGYKVLNNMAIGLGPDFQQMLVDNRPAQSSVDRNNIAVAPVFDVGFVGKTEYSITRRIKAGVVYRKGINNLLTPMDKYIDRDYLQFQVKCAVFNKK